jgi:hypothetical protein
MLDLTIENFTENVMQINCDSKYVESGTVFGVMSLIINYQWSEDS